MAFDEKLAARVREALATQKKVVEKKMFSGVAFMVNGKMCINVSHDQLMCRFDPARYEEISHRTGFESMIMKGKELKGYCYVSEEGFRKPRDFAFWVSICLEFNSRAKASPKVARKRKVADPAKGKSLKKRK